MATSFGYTSNSEKYREFKRRFDAEQQKKAEKPRLTKTKEERVYDKVLEIFLDRYNKYAKRGYFPAEAEIR